MDRRQYLGETERFAEGEIIAVSNLSAVVRAFDKDLLRDVAIKTLPPDRCTDALEIERFVEEARISGQLEHPGIVPVYEFGSDREGGRFLCMKLVRGERFEKTLERAGLSRLEPDRLTDFLQVFTKVCDAVSFAHSRGVVHRDLKTSNVMLGDFGQVYLMDWGVARSYRIPEGQADSDVAPSSQRLDPPGSIIGTPCYMAPEQLRGLHDRVDERTDIFGLGAMLYEILTAQPPWPPESVAAILRGGSAKITPPEKVVQQRAAIPLELSRICLKAMALDPADRYATVDELKGDVERFQRGAWRLPRRFVSAGTIVVRQGDRGEEAYIIVEGHCAVFLEDEQGEVLIRDMGPGDVFGEMAVLSNRPRSASVRAVTDVVLMVVTSDTLSNALGLNLWLGNFVKALADRFREVDDRLRQLEQDERSKSVRPLGRR